MKLLLIGAEGQLGRALQQTFATGEYNLTALDLPECDITSKTDIKRQLRQVQPKLVLNASAYTQVDRAEVEPETALAVNCNGPAMLAAACAQRDIPLLHISTDFVFDGRKGRPYVETDPVKPLGVYGRSKAMGEAGVRETLARHIILRTAWLYGVHGHNFVKTILRLAAANNTLRVVADQFGSPTCAADLAAAIVKIVMQYRNNGALPWGTYHYAGAGVTSWHGFAEKIIQIARAYQPLTATAVVPITSAEYPTPARRPAYSALNCGLIASTFGVQPEPWPASLAKMLAQLYRQS